MKKMAKKNYFCLHAIGVVRIRRGTVQQCNGR